MCTRGHRTFEFLLVYMNTGAARVLLSYQYPKSAFNEVFTGRMHDEYLKFRSLCFDMTTDHWARFCY